MHLLCFHDNLLEQRQALAARAYQEGTQFVSIEVVLKEVDLVHYLDDFREADCDMIENHVVRDDEEVDEMLCKVEHLNRFKFPYLDRVKLWKALRYRWFMSPECAKSYIDACEVPELSVPKNKTASRDAGVDLRQLDSERLRMVTRKAVFDEVEGTRIVQEEVYKRQTPLYYELVGLERTVEFWLNQDPRKMSREDPREEVFLGQMKMIELDVASLIDRFKIKIKVKKLVLRVFTVVYCLFLVLAVFFLVIAIVNARTATGKSATETFYSTWHLPLAALYLCTFFYIFEITRKRQQISNYEKAKKMHAKCRFMYNDMISFRLKTHHARMQNISRYIDDAAKVAQEEPAPKRKSATNAVIHRQDVTIRPYEEYMGAGVLTGRAVEDVLNQIKDDLPEGRRNSNGSLRQGIVLPQNEDAEEFSSDGFDADGQVDA